MSRRTIAHVISTLNVGGAEKQLALLVRELNRSKFRPVVACTTSAGPLLDELTRCDVPVSVIGKRRRLDVSLVWKLTRWLSRQQPDLVHTWMFTANTWGRLAALAARAPAIIASERSVDSWKAPLHRGIDRLLSRATHRILANSEAVARFLCERERIPASRIRVIPNGIDPDEAARLQRRQPEEVATLRRALGVPENAPVIGDVARIDHQHDLLRWVAVVERLASHHPELVALLVGNATLEIEQRYALRLQKEIQRRGLGNRVRLLGLRRDLEKVLPVFDLFLHTSLTEGFPNAVMEAMAAGLPVVATAVGGTPELVQHGVTGFLAPAGDVKGLADHALRLLSDAPLRRSLGEAGSLRVREEFSLRRSVEATERVYEDVFQEVSRG